MTMAEEMNANGPPVAERLMTIDEARDLLRLTRTRMYQLIRDGIIPSVRLGRGIRLVPAELRAFIARGGQGFERTWRRGEVEVQARQQAKRERQTSSAGGRRGRV
jgi:putative molybdopterin biosynthesis protein